ncbi:MAG: GH12 family glycosyl hydrolase domain-containing protein [Planctomycetota bacterium]|jgi:hypothetical protein
MIMHCLTLLVVLFAMLPGGQAAAVEQSEPRFHRRLDIGDQWMLFNNVWGSRWRGVAGEQRIWASDGGLPGGWSWSWPTQDGHDITGYPSAVYGERPWGWRGPRGGFPCRLHDLRRLELRYDVTIEPRSDTGRHNLALDLWLCHSLDDRRLARARSFEIMIWVDRRHREVDGERIVPIGYRWNDPHSRFTAPGGERYELHIDDITLNGHTWQVCSFLRDDLVAADGEGSPGLGHAGTIDVAAFLNHLVVAGLVPADEFLVGFEFGTEVIDGAADLTLHDLALTVEVDDEAR